MPFLFIGSGFSRRYLNTENWEYLLRHFTDIIHPLDEYSYEKYESKAQQLLKDQNKEITKNNLYTTVADLIEVDFNNFWYTDERYAESRKIYRNEVKLHRISPFKIEIANHFNSLDMEKTPEKYSREIHLLKGIGKKSIAGAITTNYDKFLEYIYPEHTVYISQEELIFSPTFGINEIYKIHGCSSKPETIVINSSDYESFNKKNAYLAAKLMTIFVEHPIIFLGYSLEDENVQAIIKSIVDCLSEENLEKLKDRLIFVEWREGWTNFEVSFHSRDFGQGKSIGMTRIITESYEPLFEILLNNKAKYSTKLFRRLKQDMYELALTSQAPERILVMPFNDQQMENDEEPQVVIGFGILEFGRQGYRSITAQQIFRDIVFDDQNFISNFLVEETLPVVLKYAAYSLPVFKYLTNYSGILPNELERFINYTFEDFLTKTIRKNRERYNFQSIDEVIKKEKNLTRQVRFIQTIPEEKMDADRLHLYLKSILEQHPDILSSKSSQPIEVVTGIKKLIRMYDFLKYK